jgi:hypothetical protein
MPTRAQSLDQLERWLRAFYQVFVAYCLAKNNANLPQLCILCSKQHTFPHSFYRESIMCSISTPDNPKILTCIGRQARERRKRAQDSSGEVR